MLKVMQRLSLVVSLFVALGLLAPVHAQESRHPATATAGVSTPYYQIQPGDILSISVWKEKDLQEDVLVRPDGWLSFPLTGDIQASGRTIEQVRKEVTTRLAKFIPDPVVTVTLKQVIGNVIYVIGKVNKPGIFVANGPIDVMQALSLAGGMTPYASENSIKILRRVNGTETATPFKYGQVEDGEHLSQNIVLQAGDVVVVP
ncbi:MAG: polysaccharide biosynthesis/export family protein [Acidobacteriaceae bacterium]